MFDSDVFLRAEWRHLVMLNFEVEADVLEPFVPSGTEIDQYRGTAFLSVVGFQFSFPRLLGIPIPFHTQFSEVNLRFYVRRRVRDQWRSGVVFLREIVPRWLISTVARVVYQENFRHLPVTSRTVFSDRERQTVAEVEYTCQFHGDSQRLGVCVNKPLEIAEPDSLNEFIVDHYYAYSTQRDGTSREYQVDHPRWKIAPASRVIWDCDARALFGPALGETLCQTPASAFLADGSAVAVHRGKLVTLPRFQTAALRETAPEKSESVC